jgi:hypothetical protein
MGYGWEQGVYFGHMEGEEAKKRVEKGKSKKQKAKRET